MILIGISGKKKSGKDTVFSNIRALLPLLNVERIGFADALKQEVASAFGVSIEYLEANKTAFRSILQAWGDGRREITSKTYWIEKVTRKLNDSRADVVVIPDVRYKNEFNFINTLGGYMIRLHRSNWDSSDQHPSEIELDGVTFKHNILNDTTLDDLFDHSRNFLRYLKQIE